jgi:hypothetical protein
MIAVWRSELGGVCDNMESVYDVGFDRRGTRARVKLKN